MNKFAMALIAAVFASPASFAASQPLFYFGKANVSEAEFTRDRDACSHAATKPVWGAAQVPLDYTVVPMTYPPSSAPPSMHGGGNVTTLTYGGNSNVFAQCMLAKGYLQGLPPMPAGKPGLYEFRKSTNAAMFIANDLSKMPVAAQQQASAAALAQPGPVFHLCVPADGAKLLSKMAGLSTGCTYSNVMRAPNGFSADAVCQKDQALHIAFESATPDSRAFVVNARPAHAAAVPLIDKMAINWVSADCGDLPAGSVRTPDGKVVDVTKP
jgi:hypothetical protein